MQAVLEQDTIDPQNAQGVEKEAPIGPQPEIEVSVEPLERQIVGHASPSTERLCKNNDGRPAHKLSVYCLECCQTNLKRNQEQAKAKPKANPGDLSAKERLFNWTMENLPVFDPTWTQEVYERWAKLHGDLMEMAKRLDGEGIA